MCRPSARGSVCPANNAALALTVCIACTPKTVTTFRRRPSVTRPVNAQRNTNTQSEEMASSNKLKRSLRMSNPCPKPSPDNAKHTKLAAVSIQQNQLTPNSPLGRTPAWSTHNSTHPDRTLVPSVSRSPQTAPLQCSPQQKLPSVWGQRGMRPSPSAPCSATLPSALSCPLLFGLLSVDI